jgi:hypothetical protein
MPWPGSVRHQEISFRTGQVSTARAHRRPKPSEATRATLASKESFCSQRLYPLTQAAAVAPVMTRPRRASRAPSRVRTASCGYKPTTSTPQARKRRASFARDPLLDDLEISRAVFKALNELGVSTFSSRTLADQAECLDSASLTLSDALFNHVLDLDEDDRENSSDEYGSSIFGDLDSAGHARHVAFAVTADYEDIVDNVHRDGGGEGAGEIDEAQTHAACRADVADATDSISGAGVTVNAPGVEIGEEVVNLRDGNADAGNETSCKEKKLELMGELGSSNDAGCHNDEENDESDEDDDEDDAELLAAQEAAEEAAATAARLAAAVTEVAARKRRRSLVTRRKSSDHAPRASADSRSTGKDPRKIVSTAQLPVTKEAEASSAVIARSTTALVVSPTSAVPTFPAISAAPSLSVSLTEPVQVASVSPGNGCIPLDENPSDLMSVLPLRKSRFSSRGQVQQHTPSDSPWPQVRSSKPSMSSSMAAAAGSDRQKGDTSTQPVDPQKTPLSRKRRRRVPAETPTLPPTDVASQGNSTKPVVSSAKERRLLKDTTVAASLATTNASFPATSPSMAGTPAIPGGFAGGRDSDIRLVTSGTLLPPTRGSEHLNVSSAQDRGPSDLADNGGKRTGAGAKPGIPSDIETEHMSARIDPWWKQSSNLYRRNRQRGATEKLSVVSTTPSDFTSQLRDFVTALAWACVTKQSGSAQLLDDHKMDPSSRGGTVYSVVANVLASLEQARNMEHCATKWSSEVIDLLQHRPVLCHCLIKYDPSFVQFAGCEACLRHNASKYYMWVSGSPYDAKSYWPDACLFSIQSAEELPSGSRRLFVQLDESRRGPELVSIATSSDYETNKTTMAVDTNDVNTEEFWLDSNCLFKCAIYHELTHAVARVSSCVRGVIIQELGKGHIDVQPEAAPGPMISMQDHSGGNKDNMRRLEKHLVAAVIHNEDFMVKVVQQLSELHEHGISRLGAKAGHVLGCSKSVGKATGPTAGSNAGGANETATKPRESSVADMTGRKIMSRPADQHENGMQSNLQPDAGNVMSDLYDSEPEMIPSPSQFGNSIASVQALTPHAASHQ